MLAYLCNTKPIKFKKLSFTKILPSQIFSVHVVFSNTVTCFVIVFVPLFISGITELLTEHFRLV